MPIWPTPGYSANPAAVWKPRCYPTCCSTPGTHPRSPPPVPALPLATCSKSGIQDLLFFLVGRFGLGKLCFRAQALQGLGFGLTPNSGLGICFLFQF